MRPSELKRRLKKKGLKIERVKHGGDHDRWYLSNGTNSEIPRHGKEIHPDTLQSILKDFQVSL